MLVFRKKEEWISVTDDNMFRTSDDLFKTTPGATSSNLFIEQLVSKSEKSLASQTKSLTSKKYSEDLSRTNYTSSSSSSSSSNDERESDDDDNDLFGSSKKSKSKKYQLELISSNKSIKSLLFKKQET